MNQKRFITTLLDWWRKNGRRYPWRRTRDPYRIFVSEALLHRTKAAQVLPVYSAVLRKYPTFASLASAELGELQRILHPLGLFWRVGLMVEASKQIEESHDGQVPEGMNELKSLPGVGSYIAAAISCFAYGRPEVLLDINTLRVFGRVFQKPVTDGSRRSKVFHRLGSQLLDRSNPREFNYALIDLAALVCRPQNPKCDACPVQPDCRYGLARQMHK